MEMCREHGQSGAFRVAKGPSQSCTVVVSGAPTAASPPAARHSRRCASDATTTYFCGSTAATRTSRTYGNGVAVLMRHV